jgi:hypothetical protein
MKTGIFSQLDICLVWALSLFVLVGCFASSRSAWWDYKIITTAAQRTKAGIDPYLAGVAEQDAFMKSAAAHTGGPPPFPYVYPPITLPALKLFGSLPEVVGGACYMTAYGLMIILQIGVSLKLAEPGERRFLSLIAPVSLFCPGWLFFPSIFGGNIAFLLYGLIFGAFWLGWKRDRWLWFYAAVVLASCIKSPYLVYLAIPLLCRRGKLAQVSIAAICGVGLFAVQKLVCPELFQHCMLALNRVFTCNNDFGSGPAGRFSEALVAYTSHYAAWGTAFYLLTAVVLFGVLLYLAEFYKQGLLTDEQWFPVMLLGVSLLYPRLIEYDLFAFTLAMALIAFRLVRASAFPRVWTAVAIALWIGANVWIMQSGKSERTVWKNIECVILLGLFAGGCTLLLRRVRAAEAAMPALV